MLKMSDSEENVGLQMDVEVFGDTEELNSVISTTSNTDDDEGEFHINTCHLPMMTRIATVTVIIMVGWFDPVMTDSS